MLRTHGTQAVSRQILNPGFSHWFSRHCEGVAGYIDGGRFRFVAGGPLCDSSRTGAVVSEMEQNAGGVGRQLCFFGIEEPMARRLERDSGYHRILLGYQPVWDPVQWHETFNAQASLRAQKRRASKCGLEIRRLDRPGEEVLVELAEARAAWLRNKGLAPMRFLADPFVDWRQDFSDRRIFLARCGDSVVAFAGLIPVHGREGWLVEQTVRTAAAPNGTMEALIDFAACSVAAEGARYFSLGLAPLTGESFDGSGLGLRLVVRTAWRTGGPWYDFRGLAAWKAKFRPHSWEPVYAAVKGSRFPWAAFHGMAVAFCGQKPGGFICKNILRPWAR